MMKVAVAFAALLLVGCSSSDSGSVADRPSDTASRPEATQAPDSVALSDSNLEEVPVIPDQDPRYLFNILTGAGGGLLVTRTDGTDVVALATDVPGVLKHGDWAPDGEQIVFSDETDETMWIAHLDGSPSEKIPECDGGGGCDYPAWSPDGSKIAFSRAEPSPSGPPAALSIEVLDLASGEVSTVVRLERPLLADVPRWSADGTELVIGVDQFDNVGCETGSAIATVPVAGGEPTYLTDFEMYGYAPDWNQATGTIVFGTPTKADRCNADESEPWDVWVIEPDGTGLRKVTNAAVGEQFRGAKWTPDGTQILAWSSLSQAGVNIDPDTGAVTALPSPPSTGAPKLRPS